MIKVNNLHKKYINGAQEFEALKGINLEIKDGESLAIIGKSGSGKSTLMHLLAGLDTPTEGEVIYDERSISKMDGKELSLFRNEKIGFVFQQFFLQPNLTCIENVELPLKISGVDKKTRQQRATLALEEVEMQDKLKNKATNLSGGQKQRVCIARAIVGNPKVIFADEPTGNLDSETGERITKLLFKLNKEKGITLIVVTHDEDLASMCDRKVYIKDGNIQSETK